MALDRVVYSKLLEILELSEQGNTDTQKYVHENLANFQQNRKDVALYYLEASLGAKSFHSKQMALLLLKNSILQSWHQTDLGIQNLIKSEIIKIVNLKEVQLRNVVASCYVSIFNVEGYEKWPYGIENLLGIISSLNDEFVVETAVVTLNMILEDSLNSSTHMTNVFVNYLKSTFLTKLFQIATKSSGSMELVSRIVLVLLESNMLVDYLVGEMFNHFWNLLGNMASLETCNAKKCVVKGMQHVWDASPITILQSSDAVFPYITKLCSDESYTIQIDALDLYTHILQSQLYPNTGRSVANEDLKNLLLTKMNKEFPMLLKSLVDNTKYSSWDYMSMDRTHLEDDNANIPDDMQDVPVKSREDEETNTWGNTWTIRKGSALLLDTISQLYCNNADNQVIKALLMYIQEKLESPDWELKESGVLTLGAIAKGSLYSLFPYLPKVIDYLIVVARDRVPLLRIISCWCISRFVEWIFLPENAPNYLERTLMTILEDMVDRNKRVQESACSAFTSFEECGTKQLLPYVPRILQVILKCLEIYQARNFMILYDVIGTLYQNVGDQVVNDVNHVVLMDVLLKKLEYTSFSDIHFTALMECLSSVVSILGNKLPVPFVEKLTRLSILTLYNLATDMAELDMNNQVVEILADTLSILLTSGSGYSTGDSPRLMPYDMNKLVLGVFNNLKMTNNIDLVVIMNELCSSKIHNVVQSCIALLGDMSNCKLLLNDQSLSILVDNLQYYLNITTNPPSPNASPDSTRYNHFQSFEGDIEYYFGIINNCVWVFGVLCDNQLRIYNTSNIDVVFMLLVKVLNVCSNNVCVLQNTCLTLGKFCKYFPTIALKYLNTFLKPLCQHLTYSKNDNEKIATILSVTNLFHLHLQSSAGGLSAGTGFDEMDLGSLVLLFRLYLSSCKGTLDNFGDTFGTNTELIQVTASVTKSLLQRYPKLSNHLDPQTTQELSSFLRYAK